MSSLSEHKQWWGALLVGSIVVAVLASEASGFAENAGAVLGHLLFSFLLAGIPWLIYRLIKRPLTSTQFMWTITVAWSLLALSQFVA